MHLILILTTVALAWYLRSQWLKPHGNWAQRWQRSLLFFLLPPLLLITAAVAVFCMGSDGQMVGFWDGWLSYLLAGSFLGNAITLCLKLTLEGHYVVNKIRTYPCQELTGKSVYILNVPGLFSAVIGFWRPEFFMSSELLKTFKTAHLEAVLAHEQAHYDYRDTFWFFWLGWLRQLTAWLPNTKALWEELLVLRELRADAKAALQVDSLLLAEALLLVASSGVNFSDSLSMVGAVELRSRLEERIEALLSESKSQPKMNQWFWAWLLFALLPLMAIPFHRN